MQPETPRPALPPPNPIASLAYNGLVRLARLDNHPRTSRYWRKAWQISCKLFAGPTRTRIHGQPVILNYGHTYPVFSRRFPEFNNPLIELVYQAHAAAQRPVVLIDIGANIGDTVIMLNANCPGMIDQFYCVEGDTEFFAYLRQNTGGMPNVRLLHTLLAAEAGYEGDLVQIHPGTASVRSDRQRQAVRLDDTLAAIGARPADILKVDVDGFDGQVLLGSQRLLERDQPAVIFEWHPELCRAAGNNWIDHFDALEEYGYHQFIWYSKFGRWSHLMAGIDRPTIDLLADLCLRSRAYYDWHYDVIALPPDSPLAPLALAELGYARRRPSRY